MTFFSPSPLKYSSTQSSTLHPLDYDNVSPVAAMAYDNKDAAAYLHAVSKGLVEDEMDKKIINNLMAMSNQERSEIRDYAFRAFQEKSDIQKANIRGHFDIALSEINARREINALKERVGGELKMVQSASNKEIRINEINRDADLGLARIHQSTEIERAKIAQEIKGQELSVEKFKAEVALSKERLILETQLAIKEVEKQIEQMAKDFDLQIQKIQSLGVTLSTGLQSLSEMIRTGSKSGSVSIESHQLPFSGIKISFHMDKE